MLFFPQLSTGAIAQFPIRKTHFSRTVQNLLPDSRRVRLADPYASKVQWQLTYEGLSDNEAASIRNLFQLAAGRLRSFMFIDPTDNMLRWSCDTSKPVWEKDPLIQMNPGQQDPSGGDLAVRLTNSGPLPQRLMQQIEAPGWFRFCFSLSVRSVAPTEVTLILRNSDGEYRETHRVTQNWRNISCSSVIPGLAEDVTCGIELPSGASLTLFGLQLQAQRGPSHYRSTSDRAGVYANTRFDSDDLSITADGPDDHSTRLQLTANLEA